MTAIVRHQHGLAVWAMLLLTIPAVAAQTFPDDVGDVEGNTEALHNQSGHIDIVAATILAGPEDLHVEMRLADLSNAQQGEYAGGVERWISFEFQGTVFDLVMEIADDALNTASTSILYRLDGSEWTVVREGPSEVFDNDSVAARIEYDAFKLPSGTTPQPGQSVLVTGAGTYSDGHGRNAHRFGSYGGLVYDDELAAHDDLTMDPPLTLVVPGTFEAGLAVHTPSTERYSNGEATTHYWPITIQNRGDESMEASVDVQSPEDVSVRVPRRITVPADDSVQLDLFVTTPFVHQHGASRNVTLHIDTDAGTSTLRLAVYYLKVPDPAGHHDRLWLHAEGNNALDPAASMNTAPPNSEWTALPHFVKCPPVGPGIPIFDDIGWDFRLAPQLRVGLDADTSRVGKVVLDLETTKPVPPGNLWIRLDAYVPQAESHQAQVERDEYAVSQPWGGANTGRETLELDLPLNPELDLIEGTVGQNLVLRVHYCPDLGAAGEVAYVATGSSIVIHDGSYLDLPLFDYHDPITIDASGLQAKWGFKDARKSLAPGASAVWSLRLDGSSDTYAVEAFGAEAHLARLSTTSMQAGDELRVALTVPPDAEQGDSLEIVIAATSPQDPTDAATVRLVAVVDPTSTLDEDVDFTSATPGQGSPGPGATALVAALAVFALVRRRRGT